VTSDGQTGLSDAHSRPTSEIADSFRGGQPICSGGPRPRPDSVWSANRCQFPVNCWTSAWFPSLK